MYVRGFRCISIVLSITICDEILYQLRRHQRHPLAWQEAAPKADPGHPNLCFSASSHSLDAAKIGAVQFRRGAGL